MTFQLQIPAQLIILSLWLLENKYSGGGAAAHSDRGRQSLRGGDSSPRMTASLSPSGVKRGGNKRVNPARGRGRSRSASGSPARAGVEEAEAVAVAAGEQRRDGMEASLARSTLREAEEVRTAYEHVLDGSVWGGGWGVGWGGAFYFFSLKNPNIFVCYHKI